MRAAGREARIKKALCFGVCVCVCPSLSPYIDKMHVDMFPKEISLKVSREGSHTSAVPEF